MGMNSNKQIPSGRRRHLHSVLAELWRSRSAVAAIEFAFLMPVFLILFAGIVDIGMMLVEDYRLDQAVAAGEEYASINASSVNSTNGATLASNIATAVENANGNAWANDSVIVNDGPSVTMTNGTASSGGTASNADSCYCPTGSPPSWTWGSSMTCGASCAGGGTAGKFVAITATASYTPFLTIYHFINSGTLRQSAVVETQ
ncbi:MAG TPA: TadE/TadG family type IV pilus assembly protein [Rhizomicrobium sp.]|nr:TadE/TadG family type IV pilus assembly protein [Rhizomicrobium sp.]